MKRLLVCTILLFLGANLFAQNIQLHRDFGENRDYFTTTVEMFKPDKLGNTFLFIDMNYNDGDVNGVSLAYWEIARVVKLESLPVGFHVEYDGGFGQWKQDTLGGAFQINDAWLAGLDYSWNNEDFSKGFSLKAMYKYIDDKHDASFQLTTVWYMHFFNRKLSFTGFADFWKEDNIFRTEETEFVFLAEPQLWYNPIEHFSLGTEVEISSNFVDEGFKLMPTLAVRWTF